MSLPPGPRWPASVQTVAFLGFRTPFMRMLVRRYGPAYTIRIHPGPRTIATISAPEHIKQVFAGDPRDLHAGEGNQVLRPVMGEHSVLLTDEAEHMRARKLLMPAFNGASLRGYRGLVESLAKEEVDRWHDGERLVTHERMNALTLEVILQVVFGVTDEKTLGALRPRIRRMVEIGPTMFVGWIFPRLRSLGPWKRYFDNQAAVDRILYAEIAARRQVSDLDARTDVLSRLLQVGVEGDLAPLTDAELRDQLVTLLLAGHETTASALSWTLYELGANPDVQDEALRAADTGDDAFVEACLKEAMRRHPVIDSVARRLTTPQRVGPWDLPAGTVVSPSIAGAHFTYASFPEPARFRPRRFLDDDIAPGTWIPFGGGVRRCLGAGFSLMEGTAVLKEILTRYRVSVDAEEVSVVRNITHVPEHGAVVTLHARSS
ncbi:cytochrome P450 [Mumia sp. zg.B53]|uniref:cytochrome P450 n=1 Tax=unclassified Mumia TaxID=2621872 RepID=UPI001C6E7DD2|nr:MULTISPECIES: cytochrome P450 [unclassified Mumia]MBW9209571.1 cytochrome P450 [Mumia sp. zg.B21]MBW9214176.1 cytochrome P450 [Mumia sp. zg.B53]